MWPDLPAIGETVISSFEGVPRRFKVVGESREMRLFDLTSENPWVMYILHAQRSYPAVPMCS